MVSPDGRVVARAENNAVRLWDGAHLVRISTALRGEAFIRAMAFSRDGTRLAATVDEHGTRIASVPRFSQETIDAARRIAGRDLTDEERSRYFLSGE